MRKIRVFFLVIFICSVLSYDPAGADRTPPKKVSPVVYNDIKYSAPQSPSSSHKQTGGYIEAWNTKTNTKLWELKIYDVKFNPKLEWDVQEVYITSLKLDGEKLIITNENSDVYELDIKTKTVRKSGYFLPQASKKSVIVK